jgi:hypothetical protein
MPWARLVRIAVQRLAKQQATREDCSVDEVVQLANTSAHAFRHTFGTRAVARAMPTDVVQAISRPRLVADHLDLCAGGARAHARGCSALLRRRGGVGGAR